MAKTNVTRMLVQRSKEDLAARLFEMQQLAFKVQGVCGTAAHVAGELSQSFNPHTPNGELAADLWLAIEAAHELANRISGLTDLVVFFKPVEPA